MRKETVRGIRRTVFMHRQIVVATPDQEVHHKNRNTLDNRRSNLELTTPRDHHLTHAQLRLLITNPNPHAACAQFLATRGITALCHRPLKTGGTPQM